MRLNRVLVPELRAGATLLRGPEAHHLRDVLRVRPGAPIEAFDGRGNVAAGSVAAVDRDGVALTLEEPRPSGAEPAAPVAVAVALLKNDKLSDVVRQCTELGATAFVLLVTRRADATAMSAAKLQRLARVAEEAARQSGRALVPTIAGPLPLGELTWEGAALVADPRAGLPLARAGVNPAEPLTLITGPEGGLAPEEVAGLTERGAVAVGLGPRVLRAETAPVALTAAVLLGAAS